MRLGSLAGSVARHEAGVLALGLLVLPDALSDFQQTRIVAGGALAEHLGLSIRVLVRILQLVNDGLVEGGLEASGEHLGFAEAVLEAGVETDGGLAPATDHGRALA